MFTNKGFRRSFFIHMTKRQLIFTAIALLVLFLLAIPKIWFNNNIPVQGKPKSLPVQVGTLTIRSANLEKNIVVAGELHAFNVVQLRTEASGRVTAINFKEGSAVNKGQLLLKLNDLDLTAQLKKVQSVSKMKELSLQRAKQLLNGGGISQETFDQVSTESQSALADVDLIKEQIRKTQLVAPFSGTIGITAVNEGAYLTLNSPVVSLQQTNQLKLDFSVPEKYAAYLKPGMLVAFSTESSNNKFQAKIAAIEPSIDPTTRNRSVRAIFDNNKQTCFPGSFAKVYVSFALNNKAILVPSTCIVPILKGQKVYVVQGDSVVNRNVLLGERLDSMVEITDGLQPGDVIVSKGVIQLKPGSKINSK